MSAAVKIAEWVERKPLILIRFDVHLSESLHNTKQGLERFTIVKPHSVFQDYKLPTPCLLELQEDKGTKCYLGTATRKIAVSTFDSRLTIKKLRLIASSSLHELAGKVTDTRKKGLLKGRLHTESGFSKLSPQVSSHLIHVLAQDQANHAALDTALSLLKLRRIPHVNWAQEDAIHSAMAVFGIREHEIPNEVVLKRGASSSLSLIGAHLYEDNVVHADAICLPGFEMIEYDVTGRAVFEKRDERLVIYTANKLPLEQMLGVDLIYVNETRGNIVMIQYKMLEQAKSESHDWLFRPGKQLWDEIARMQIPTSQETLTDYRLSRNPFFFKFVKRKIVDGSPKSFFVSLDHLSQILTSSLAEGPKGGIRLSYDVLDGTYLREADMISLIRSGYVGTHRAETEALTTIIAEVAEGNKALVLAWQKKVRNGGSDP